MGTAKGFTGQYNDSVSGLDYYNARYYDSTAAVFLSVDTIQGNIQGMNPYDYVGGNPETRNDPTGQRFSCPDPQGCNGGSSSSSTPPPPPPVNNWWDTVGNFFHTAYNVGNQLGDLYNQANLKVIDFLTGYSSIGNDVHTIIFNNGVSETDIFKAEGDLLLNFGMNALMLTGIGEVIRGGELGLKGVSEVVTHADQIEHGASSLLSHLTEACGGGLSLTATTRVATALGKSAISTLHPGDRVWAYNPNTHKMELQPILHVWINHDNDLMDLTLTATTAAQHGKAAVKSSETLHTNQKHPFLTREKGFLPVSQITLGMHVRRANGTFGVVTGWKVVPGVKTMYNLEIAQDHTFTVGDGQWVVHNSNCVGEITSSAPGDYLRSSSVNEAPMLSPGNRFLRGVHINDKGLSKPWIASYDEFGRQIGRTDVTLGNKVMGFDPIHYHIYQYVEDTGKFFKGIAGVLHIDHLPGIFDPFK